MINGSPGYQTKVVG